MSEVGWLVVVTLVAMGFMWYLTWRAARRGRVKKGAAPKPWLHKGAARRGK